MQHFDIQPNVSPRNRPRAFQTLGGVARLSLSYVSHKVVDYLLLMEYWLKADVDKRDIVFSRLRMSLVPNASYVHAHGIVTNSSEEIETLRALHGVRKGNTTVFGSIGLGLRSCLIHYILPSILIRCHNCTSTIKSDFYCQLLQMNHMNIGCAIVSIDFTICFPWIHRFAFESLVTTVVSVGVGPFDISCSSIHFQDISIFRKHIPSTLLAIYYRG